jgi:DNA-binding NarL/FixJ family response regulator
LPNLDGLKATREIRNIFPEIEVVILSHYETPQMAEQAFHAGARGYVVKSSISNSLLAHWSMSVGTRVSWIPASFGFPAKRIRKWT